MRSPPALIADLSKVGLGVPHSLNRLSLPAAGAALGDQAHSANVKLRAMQMADVAAQPRMGSKAIKV